MKFGENLKLIRKEKILEFFEKSGHRLGIKKMHIKLRTNNIVCFFFFDKIIASFCLYWMV